MFKLALEVYNPEEVTGGRPPLPLRAMLPSPSSVNANRSGVRVVTPVLSPSKIENVGLFLGCFCTEAHFLPLASILFLMLISAEFFAEAAVEPSLALSRFLGTSVPACPTISAS